MKEYFRVLFEFDKAQATQIIERSIDSNSKGYVCVVDGNVLTTAERSAEYRKILNNSLVNICDGSSIAKMAGLIHKEKLESYKGPELFNHLVKKNYKQLFLGNTSEVLKKMQSKFHEDGIDTNLMQFIPLPFGKVDDFDYHSIAREIIEFSPEIIWISLGAPKQEIFMSRLITHLHNCVVIAVGAAFNFFINDKQNKRAPRWVQNLHLEWLYRIFREPRKASKRSLKYLKVLPRLVFEEIKKVRYINAGSI